MGSYPYLVLALSLVVRQAVAAFCPSVSLSVIQSAHTIFIHYYPRKFLSYIQWFGYGGGGWVGTRGREGGGWHTLLFGKRVGGGVHSALFRGVEKTEKGGRDGWRIMGGV